MVVDGTLLWQCWFQHRAMCVRQYERLRLPAGVIHATAAAAIYRPHPQIVTITFITPIKITIIITTTMIIAIINSTITTNISKLW